MTEFEKSALHYLHQLNEKQAATLDCLREINKALASQRQQRDQDRDRLRDLMSAIVDAADAIARIDPGRV